MQNEECRINGEKYVSPAGSASRSDTGRRATLHVARKLAVALASGILLFFSFPPFEYAYLAWIALFPLILLSFSSNPGESFRYGLTTGLVFWLTSIFWLTKVSFIGWFFIGLYCALYLALFALVVSWWRDLMHRNLETLNIQRSTSNSGQMNLGSRLKVQRWMLKVSGIYRSDLILLFGIPAIWVALEYARAHFLTGFPWNLLGVSQYTSIALIQCADWGGVYLVSYLIIMGNAAVALLIDDCKDHKNTHRWRVSNKKELDQKRFVIPDLIGNPEKETLDSRFRGNDRRKTSWVFSREVILKTGAITVLFLLILLFAVQYGNWRLAQSPEKLQTIQAAAVQSNVPQQLKWSEEWAGDICRRLKAATEEACRAAQPDLIIWPETALPDLVRISGPSRELVNDARRHHIPLLIGSMDMEELPGGTNYYNSSFLFIPGQGAPQVYAKRHLVLFGEYVPFGDYFSFLRAISGVEEDFMPGKEIVVFRLNGAGQTFSVLICFEDILPYLARECVKGGARLLINQTNDAWFDPSWASRQHMTHCVFRCVENRVACLRATNTGLTCYIDRFGLIRSSLEPAGRGLREPEIMRTELEFSAENMPLTFYTRHGDLFALACAAFSLPLFIGTLLSFLRKRC